MIRPLVLAAMVCPTFAFSGDITVSDAFVPLAPDGVMAHAAYMSITNDGDAKRSLVGAKAPNYAMAHLHHSMEKDGIVSMSSMDQVDLEPGQTVTFQPGGMHVMLMKPAAILSLGDTVDVMLEFTNGDTVPVSAKVVKLDGSS